MSIARIGTEFLVNTTTPNDQDRSTVTALSNGRFLVTWNDNSQTGADTVSGAIRARIFNANGTEAVPEFVVNANPNSLQSESSATALSDGMFMVTFTDFNIDDDADVFGGAIRARIFNADGTEAVAQFRVNDLIEGGQAESQSATLQDGRLVVTWSDFSGLGDDPTGSGVRARIFNTDGTQSVAAFQVNSITDGDQTESDVAVLTNGNIVVTWTDRSNSVDDPDFSAVRARIFNTSGVEVEPEFLVNTTTAAFQFESRVAALQDGRFIVTYRDSGATDNVLARIFNANGTESVPEFVVSTTTDGNQFQGKVVILADGRILCTWADSSGLGGDAEPNAIKGRILNADGTEAIPEFLINTITTAGQQRSEVAALADGSFMVTWRDESLSPDDASGRAIRSQIFNPLVFDGTAAADDVTGGSFGDTYAGNDGADSIAGLGGNDSLSGGSSNDTLNGGIGNDTLTGGSGVDSLVGDEGDDLFLVDNAADVVVEGAGGGTLDRIATSVSYTLATGVEVERIQTTSSAGTTALNLRGNALAQSIFGNAGDNVLNDGGFGAADTLTGGLGNDTYIVNNTATQIVEGAGQGTNDRVAAGLSFALAADDDIERLTTTNVAGTDALNLAGNAGVQTITGNAGVNRLSDGGGAGADTMIGLAGNDIYVVGNAATQIVESAGQGTADRVAAAVSFVLAADDNIELLTTSAQGDTTAINLTGNALVQSIIGNFGDNVLSDGGGAGADTLNGLGGNDTFIIRNAGTVIAEIAGQGTADRVAAGVSFVLAADDNIEILTTTSSSGTGAINLTGNLLAQTITGNAGANRLNGGGGTDVLTGLGGADTFLFNTALGATNIDTITDFNVAADTIELEDAIFTGLAAGPLAAAAFRLNASGLAENASDRIVYDSVTGNLYFDADGTGATARVQFAVLDAGLVLTSADFLVI